jgi:hypothetical protein
MIHTGKDYGDVLANLRYLHDEEGELVWEMIITYWPIT